MTEVIGYLTLSYHADAFLKWIAITLGIIILALLLCLPVFIEEVPPSSKKTFFTYLSVIASILAITAIGISWFYQTKAIEICTQTPDCDYHTAAQAARKVMNTYQFKDPS